MLADWCHLQLNRSAAEGGSPRAAQLNAKIRPQLAGCGGLAMAGGLPTRGRHPAPGRAGSGVSSGGGRGGQAAGDQSEVGLPAGGAFPTSSADQLAGAGRAGPRGP